MRRVLWVTLGLCVAAPVIPSKDGIAAQPAPSERVVREVAALLDSVVAVERLLLESAERFPRDRP